MKKYLALVMLLTISLTGYGAHLQHEAEVPAQFKTPFYINSDPYGRLTRDIKALQHDNSVILPNLNAKQHQEKHPLQSLIEQYGGIGFEKQIDLEDVIVDKPWEIDMDELQLVFGDDLHCSFQLLGTFSHSTKTWLWAWANEQSDLPEDVIEQSLELKKYGEENNIDLFKTPKFDATEDDLHLFGLIASGMFKSSGYYIADFGQGTLVLTFNNDYIDQIHKENDTHYRVASVIPQLIADYEVNHYAAIKHYLLAKDYQIIFDDGLKLIATKGGKQITAEFDNSSRIIGLKS